MKLKSLSEAFVEYFQEVFGAAGVLGLLGADAFFEHLEAEGAGNANGVGFGFEVLVGADVVDAVAAALLYPHVAAARAAAEALLPASLHLDQFQARDRLCYLAGLVVDAVVPVRGSRSRGRREWCLSRLEA